MQKSSSPNLGGVTLVSSKGNGLRGIYVHVGMVFSTANIKLEKTR